MELTRLEAIRKLRKDHYVENYNASSFSYNNDESSAIWLELGKVRANVFFGVYHADDCSCEDCCKLGHPAKVFEYKALSWQETLSFIKKFYKRHDDGLRYVNAYAITRHYGGPEEGGWWYNAGSPLCSVPVLSRAEEKEWIEKLKERFADENEGDIYSVLGGSKLETSVENHQAEEFPKQRPHYE